jgi:hypothetical protein
MGQHLAAWFESIDQAALGRITTVQDDVLTPTGADRFLVPQDYNYIHYAFATGLNLSGARIVTPSLEVAKSDLDILPFGQGADLLTISQPAVFIPQRPIALAPSESIEVQTSEDGSSATTQQAFVSLGTAENEPMPSGNIRSVRATGVTTVTADTWHSVTLTLETSLEAGSYTLVHFLPFGTTVVAARWLPQGGGYRPGMYGIGAAAPDHFDFPTDPWNRLGWYNMLRFTHITIPQIQYFCTAGDSAQTVQMYIIRTGDA